MQLFLRPLRFHHLGRGQPQRQDKFHPAGKVAEQVEEFVAQLFVELAPHETVGGNVHHHRPQRGDQVEFALIPQTVHKVQGFFHHYRHILLHRRRLEAGHDDAALAQVFFHFGKGIEVGRKHLEEERHRFPDRQQFIRFLKEEAVVFRPQHHIHAPTGKVQREQTPARFVAAFQNGHRIAEELQQVTQNRRATIQQGQAPV